MNWRKGFRIIAVAIMLTSLLSWVPQSAIGCPAGVAVIYDFGAPGPLPSLAMTIGWNISGPIAYTTAPGVIALPGPGEIVSSVTVNGVTCTGYGTTGRSLIATPLGCLKWTIVNNNGCDEIHFTWLAGATTCPP